MEGKQLSSEEKDELWERINRGVAKGGVRQANWLKVAAAVAVLGAAATAWFISKEPASPLEEMMEIARVADTITSKEVRVVAVRPGGTSEDKNLPIYRTVVVPYGERTVVELPDSTRIWLNSGSTLVYPELFAGGQRQVYLEGEGYFDVRHNEDQPFFVQLRDMEIKVLGTEFNVSAYTDDESANVMLVKGSVELRLSGDSSSEDVKARLAPHEMAVYRTTDHALEVRRAPADEYASWRSGFMVFRNTELADILKRLQRYYRIRIRLEQPGLAAVTFSGPLDLKKEIDQVLDIICLTTSLEYEKKEGEIVLKEK